MSRTIRRQRPRLFLKGRSTRTRRRLLAVFALIFGLGTARSVRAACIELPGPQILSTASSSPTTVAAADVDGDGDLDLVASSLADDEVVWFENVDAALPWPVHTIATSLVNPYAVVAADLDGDGDLDVAATSITEQDLFWFANLGGGASWSSHVVSSDFASANVIVAADLDRDGDADLVTTSQNLDAVRWFANDGTGAGWSVDTVTSAFNNPAGVDVADIDRDGDPDVVVALQLDGRVAWFENDGAEGGWTLHTVALISQGARGVAAGDIDRDGDLDVAAASGTVDTIAWHENFSGDGTTWIAHTLSTTADDARLALPADLDGDGDLDLVAASAADDEIRWFENRSGNGATFVGHTVSTTTDGVISVAVADFDRDGDLDLVAPSQIDDAMNLFRDDRLHGAALFGPPQSISTLNVLAWTLVAADMDGDGDVDPGIVNGNDTSIDFWRNDSGATAWTRKQFTGFLEGGNDAAIVDLDGDGDPDAVGATEYINALLWFSNEGNFGSSNYFVDTLLTDPTAVSTGDFDGLGRPDIAVGDRTLGAVFWYANDGSPASGVWTRLTVATNLGSLSDLLSADLDADGDLDLVASRTVAGSGVVWLESDGAPSPGWARHTLLTTAGKASDLDAGDIDGDGDLDLIATVSDNSSPNVVWLENDATPTVGNWTIHTTALAAGTSATDVAAADLDGDGDLDLAVPAVGVVSDPVLFFENDGDGLFDVRTAAIVDTPTAVAALDLDRDGDLDLAVGSSTALVWVPNLGTRVHDDGFDSDANTACWSSVVP